MTLILSVQTEHSLWLLADRRLSYPNRNPVDDAVKASIVDVDDGTAIVGYAGLGATALGTQPSNWVSSVLRGRHHPLEMMLAVISDAMQREFLRHIRKIRITQQRKHSFIVPAYVNDKPRLYTIDLDDTGKFPRFRYTRHIVGGALEPKGITVPISIGGTGAAHLLQHDSWRRVLSSLVGSYNRKRISAKMVADYLANLNLESHKFTKDGTVGPNCLVVWRNSRESLYKGGGGANFYAGTTQTTGNSSIPTIANGIDIAGLANAILTSQKKSISAYFEKASSERLQQGPLNLNEDEIRKCIASLPSKPDEKLR